MERLAAQDLVPVRGDEIGWPWDIGAIGVIDGDGLMDPDGRFRIEVVRRALEPRLHLVPRFRQLLYRPPPGLGWPLWVDAASFDLADHVRVCSLAAPADQAQLLSACERLRRRRLDPSRPRWELWFLPGLAHGRVGVFARMHHAMADGIAGVAAFGAMFSLTARTPAAAAPPWTPQPVPPPRELLQDNVQQRVQELCHALSSLADPARTLRRAARSWPAWREAAVQRIPRTSLNRPIGPDRRLALVRGRLDLAARIAHAHGGTVNDVVLAAVTAGLRDLLLSRGEPVEDLVLRASVPVSLHGEQPAQARGNQVGWMAVPLPVGEPRPARRLQLIITATAERKKNARPQITSGIFRFSLAQRAFYRLLPHQRYMNVFVTNVPGPPAPLYLAGAQLLEVFPVLAITGNMTLGVGVMSYAGQLNLTAVADQDRCPDVQVFADGLRHARPGAVKSHPSPMSTAREPAGPCFRAQAQRHQAHQRH
jgi:WS/DGAT/MGAT family acyltransferase